MLRFLLFMPFHFLMIVLTYLLALPLGFLSVILGVSVLPGFLKWFHTHDDDLDGGQHQHDWPEEKGVSLAIQRARWMWRNPAYGFRATVLGITTWDAKVDIREQKGNPGDKGFVQKVTITSGEGKKYFSYRTNWFWFGWRYPQSGGYHIYKCSIRKGD